MKRLLLYTALFLVGVPLVFTGDIWAGGNNHRSERNERMVTQLNVYPMYQLHRIKKDKHYKHRRYNRKHFRKRHSHRGFNRHDNFKITNFRYNRDFQLYSAF